MPINKDIKKVMVIGSGPIVIGQAAEFDYAGAQACRVLKAEGINVVLVNSNPATIMTDKALADEIYLEPLTAETVKRIIEKEKPDSLLAGLGGQTGLTIAMQLSKDGYLDKMGVKLLGTKSGITEGVKTKFHCNVRYSGNKDHVVFGTDVAVADGWKTLTFTFSIPEDITADPADEFCFYTNPFNNEGVSYRFDNVKVKTVE